MPTIRAARPEDADAAIAVVRRSISELCTEDHHDDPQTLAGWLANKTAASFTAWIANPDNVCVVGDDDGAVIGVGLLHRSGEIRLFYLDPAARRRGIGRAIHAALEERARAWGLTALTLDSSANARPFYERMGYRSTGPATPSFGVVFTYPYEKRLD